MSYHAITEHTAANYTPGRPDGIESITIHWWGEPSQYTAPNAFETVLSYLASPNPRQSSAHYVVEAGRVACIVDPDDRAWHAGDGISGPGNGASIGIECHPRASDGDYATIAELIAELRSVYGNLPLVPHNRWTATACPGNYDLARLDVLARGQKPADTGKPKPPAPVAAKPAPPMNALCRAWIVDPGDTLGHIAGYYGLSIEAIAAANGLGDPDLIHVGQVLTIPSGGSRVYTISAGDTLGAIAGRYGVTVDSICVANGIANPNQIAAGAVLQIP